RNSGGPPAERSRQSRDLAPMIFTAPHLSFFATTRWIHWATLIRSITVERARWHPIERTNLGPLWVDLSKRTKLSSSEPTKGYGKAVERRSAPKCRPLKPSLESFRSPPSKARTQTSSTAIRATLHASCP